MKTTAVVRALYGAFLLVAPDWAIRAVAGEATERAATIGRVLGARHLLQALTVERSEQRGWLFVGIAVDIAHALSMVAIAALSSDHRRVAAFDAVVASGRALTGVRAAKRD